MAIVTYLDGEELCQAAWCLLPDVVVARFQHGHALTMPGGER